MAEDPPSVSSSSSSSSSSTSSTWLKFFLKFRRVFLQSRKPRKQLQFESKNFQVEPKTEEKKTEEKDDEKQGMRERGEMAMQKAVKKLLFGRSEEREMAAVEIARLADEDVKIRKDLAELGVIPPLVDMADSGEPSRRTAAVKALLRLADGASTNKALILEAGMLSKLPKDIHKVDDSTIHDISQLLLSISSLSNTQQCPLKNPSSSSLLPFLLTTLQSNTTPKTSKQACLGTLYNLSSVLDNSGPLISHHVVDILLTLISSSSSRDVSEKALATLGNLVVTLMGKKALEDNNMVVECLIDVLTWEDKPRCQELSAYILMILAHQSSKQREKMAKLGIVHVLLEVALLGSPLAQKRALKLLQWFKDVGRGVRVGAHSGPQTRRADPIGSPVSERETNEGKKLMKRMVRQSLYKNMEVITRRANYANGETSKLKALVISSSSKSLPY